jgi:hypothetical protein
MWAKVFVYKALINMLIRLIFFWILSYSVKVFVYKALINMLIRLFFFGFFPIQFGFRIT